MTVRRAQGLLLLVKCHLRVLSSEANISPPPPNRVNRAHWPTKENRQILVFFCIFPVHAENGLGWAQMGQAGFFPTNPDLADILGRTDLEFENFYFFHFVDHPKFLDFQVPDFPNLAWAGPGLDLGGWGEMLASHSVQKLRWTIHFLVTFPN